jgi:phenylpropionate dioxygenase-like ring-hydroxylating dioxygenase large terminal subunit
LTHFALSDTLHLSETLRLVLATASPSGAANVRFSPEVFAMDSLVAEVVAQHDETAAMNRRLGSWQRYGEVSVGLRGYWYPVAWSRSLRKKPLAIKLLRSDIVLIRDNGKAFAINDFCPHRGVRLSTGRREFAGTWTCRYHGWVFDLETGILKAALTDGPDSPACEKLRVKTFPVEERLGLIWVYMGRGVPPPLDEDIPAELRDPETMMLGRMTLQKGNWRYACENAFDEGHFKYLHRYGALFSFFQEFPAWSKVNIIKEAGGWITRDVQSVSFADDYKSVGKWPPKSFWKRASKGFRVSMHLPCIMRNHHVGTPRTNFSWYVPVGDDGYRYFQIYTMKARGFSAVKFWLHFWLFLRPVHFVQFNKQDLSMVEQLPDTPPSRLYRPDESIVEWRHLVESARQFEVKSANS